MRLPSLGAWRWTWIAFFCGALPCCVSPPGDHDGVDRDSPVSDDGAVDRDSPVSDDGSETDGGSETCEPSCWLNEPPRSRTCDDGCGGNACGTCSDGLTCVEGFWCRSRVGCGDQCDVQVLIPEGPFVRGCDPERYRHTGLYCTPDSVASPLGVVWLSAFRIDQFEVTNGRYRRCAEAWGCRRPAASCLRYHRLPPDYLFADAYRDYPAFCVDWDMADAFCRWEGRRLPTEAEWEKAARGGCEVRGETSCDRVVDAPTFVWGENAGDEVFIAPGSPTACYPPEGSCLVNIDNAYSNGPVPVSSSPSDVSPYGVFDMAGNVTEWVSDWYDPFLYRSCPEPCTDPVGDPPDPASKVHRGSSYGLGSAADATSLPVFGRPYAGYPWNVPEWMSWGFRCAADAP